MKESAPGTKSGRPRTLRRRDLLCAAAAAGGAMLAADSHATAVPEPRTAMVDPQLRAALLKYGGEFGQVGKGGPHGDL